MAGVDCGFSIHVGMQGIDPDVAWAKLAAMAEGCDARLASNLRLIVDFGGAVGSGSCAAA